MGKKSYGPTKIVATPEESTHVAIMFYIPIEGCDYANPPKTADSKAVLELRIFPTKEFLEGKQYVNIPPMIAGVCTTLNYEGLPVILGLNLFCEFVYVEIKDIKEIEDEAPTGESIPKPIENKDADKDAMDWFNSVKPKNIEEN